MLGAIVGAVAAIVGGIGGAWLISNRDDRRRVLEHKAAVRAVLQELAGNLATLRTCQTKDSANELAVVHSAYSSLLVPLLSYRLPERVATLLGKAYGRLLAVDRVAENAKWDAFVAGGSDYEDAHRALMGYATGTLKMTF